jgi:2-polyprenyl-3-methyl-5-hydroxy-6-metoxy-1,4-benzoquinol methylase
MDRIPEPELMADPEQVTAYAAADFGSSDQDFTDRVLGLLPDPACRVVDLGCGPGNISFRIAAARPAASVLGIDGAEAMVALAEQQRLAAAGAPQRLRFLRCDLADPALGRPPLAGGFGAVVSNSVLHHLHDPAVFWRAVRSLAAPGAVVVVRDLRRPDSPAAVEALVARHAADAPDILRRDYRASLLAAFRLEEVQQQLQDAGLAGWQVVPLEDRYLEVWGRITASPSDGTTAPAAQ